MFKDSAFGWDGMTTFIFSNLVLLSTLGLGFFWLLFKTIATAKVSKTCVFENMSVIAEPRAVLIAGLCLEKNQPVEEFKVRLNRAIALEKCFDKEPGAKIQLILLGGLTGGNQISEARAGADYLIARGVDAERIIVEDQSRHTLENMQQARIVLQNHQQQNGILPEKPAFKEMAIISSRYHLYRVLTLAKVLQMNLQPIAAEDRFACSFLICRRVLKEAYYLHWYWSGKLWVFITANQKSKARIS